MKIAIAQIAPVFLDRAATLDKVAAWIEKAASEGCALVAFGEALAPGYPAWLSRTGGARFDDATQKAYYARYVDEAVEPARGHLDAVCAAAARGRIAVSLGIVERAGASLFCTAAFVDAEGTIASTHRKLMPTYEERLVWSIGDGAGLVTHPVHDFRVGTLNCWENWMPLARTAMYAAGEDIHVMLWPGNLRNTEDLTPVVAKEGRNVVLSAGALLREQDLPGDLPAREHLAQPGELLHDGGSCIAGPDGRWLVEPVVGEQALLTVDVDIAQIRAERQNFDPAGHYARPDVLELIVDRRRRTQARFLEGDEA